MKIAIVGAGGVGGFLAAMLSRAGEDVLLVARGRNLEAIKRNGVCVEMGGSTLCGKPNAAESAKEFADVADVVLFCTKGYDLEAAARNAAPIVSDETLLIPLGNGVGNAQRVKNLYPNNPVANGAIYIVSHLKEPGLVEVKGKGAYVVAGMDGELSSVLRKFGEAMEKAGIKVKISEDITTEVWKKFLLISAMATLTSFYDEPMGAVVQKHSKELDEILHEILAVGKAEGAKIDEGDVERVKEQLQKVPYDSPTSMWLDFKAKKETELEELSGFVVKRAKLHGIKTPLMKRCYEELKKR